MSDDEICNLALCDFGRLYRRRTLAPSEVVEAFARRIERLNPSLNAFVTLDLESARKAARIADDAFAKRDVELPALFGIPFSAKDTLPTAGLRTTFGTTLFKDHIPAEDAAVVAHLRRSGCVLLGKTNSPAFGWTAVTDNRVFGPTPNPWDHRFTAGGSSGGAAVATAARLCPINIGTDGGGSLRVPASFTETVGFKASYGRVPNFPMGAGWPIQHLGAIARDVADAVTIFSRIAVLDRRDLASLPPPPDDGLALLDQKLPKLRILYARSLGYTHAVDPEMAKLCQAAVGTFRTFGCDVVEADLQWPSPEKIWKTFFVAGITNRLRSVADRLTELEPDLRALIEHEIAAPSDYLQTTIDRNEWSAFPLAIHTEYDLLITPTTACPPFPTGQFFPRTIDERPTTLYEWMPFTYPFNLTGQPAISMPAGRTRTGLPVGIQIIGPRYADMLVLHAAKSYEAARPPLTVWQESDFAASPL